jgi:DNA polymerase/3'-5' exonuclease PolX
MKFYELKILFNRLLDDVKKQDSPTIRYIIVAYNNVLQKISESFSDNESVTEKKLKSLELTKNMETKLLKLSETKISKGEATKMQTLQKTNRLKQQLDSLLGIGNKRADELIGLGLKTIGQLESKKWYSMLNTDTQMVLRYKPLRYIPHEDIKQIESKLIGFSKNATLVGSYRRMKPYVRDIDILFMPTPNRSLNGYLDYFMKTFHNNVWIYARGDDKISMIIQPHRNNDTRYKCDIFITNRDNHYSNLLYTTGSRQHNIKMRAKAKSMGLLLNQNGIFRDGKKINTSTDNEQKLFGILQMEYKKPELRI